MLNTSKCIQILAKYGTGGIAGSVGASHLQCPRVDPKLYLLCKVPHGFPLGAGFLQPPKNIQERGLDMLNYLW